MYLRARIYTNIYGDGEGLAGWNLVIVTRNGMKNRRSKREVNRFLSEYRTNGQHPAAVPASNRSLSLTAAATASSVHTNDRHAS